MSNDKTAIRDVDSIERMRKLLGADDDTDEDGEGEDVDATESDSDGGGGSDE